MPKRMFAAGLFWALATPAGLAADVNFNANLINSCTIALGTNGKLALAADGASMGTEESGGVGGTVTILSLGANTIDVSAPVLATAPAGYDASGQQLEIAYAGLGGLSLVSQAYTPAATSFAVGSIALSVLGLDARIVNANGFMAGNYQLQTTVTCR